MSASLVSGGDYVWISSDGCENAIGDEASFLAGFGNKLVGSFCVVPSPGYDSPTPAGRQALLESFGAGEGSEEARAFEEAYRQRVSKAYPQSPSKGITYYPFKRFFLVATRPGILDML